MVPASVQAGKTFVVVMGQGHLRFAFHDDRAQATVQVTVLRPPLPVGEVTQIERLRQPGS